MSIDLSTLCASQPFELPVEYRGAWSAPLAAQAQILDQVGAYDGDPLQACLNAFLGLQQSYKDWKVSQNSSVPHLSAIAHFAQHFGTDWFRTPDLGTFRLAVFIWVGEQVRVLRACQSTPREIEKAAAIALLKGWAELAHVNSATLIRN
jgi:hypothetical protein